MIVFLELFWQWSLAKRSRMRDIKFHIKFRSRSAILILLGLLQQVVVLVYTPISPKILNSKTSWSQIPVLLNFGDFAIPRNYSHSSHHDVALQTLLLKMERPII